jgi:hypothetical protein
LAEDFFAVRAADFVAVFLPAAFWPDDFLLDAFLPVDFLRADFFIVLPFVFFIDELPMRSIDAAPRCAFLAVLPTEVPTEDGTLPAISFAFAPATPPTTAPTAAPSGPTIEPAAAPAAAPPTMPSAELELEFSAVPLEFAIEVSSLRQPG